MGYTRQAYYSIYWFLIMTFGFVGIIVEWIVYAFRGELTQYLGWPLWRNLLFLVSIALYFCDYFAHKRGAGTNKSIMYSLLCFWVLMAALN